MFALGLVLGMHPDWMFGRALAIATVVPTIVSWPVSLCSSSACSTRWKTRG
jgi:hypothetical protein